MASLEIVPCLWLDDRAEAAASLYLETFGDAAVEAVGRYPEYGPKPAHRPPGSVVTIDLRLEGLRLTLLDGGPGFHPNPSVSFHVIVGDEAEVDAMHGVLSGGGAEMMPLGAYRGVRGTRGSPTASASHGSSSPLPTRPGPGSCRA